MVEWEQGAQLGQGVGHRDRAMGRAARPAPGVWGWRCHILGALCTW